MNEQTEHDPVAIVNKGMGGIEWLSEPLPDDTPLYTALPKREWVGLTDDDEIAFEWERVTGHSIFGGDPWDGRQMFLSPNEILEFVEVIEAKLKQKNTEIDK